MGEETGQPAQFDSDDFDAIFANFIQEDPANTGDLFLEPLAEPLAEPAPTDNAAGNAPEANDPLSALPPLSPGTAEQPDDALPEPVQPGPIPPNGLAEVQWPLGEPAFTDLPLPANILSFDAPGSPEQDLPSFQLDPQLLGETTGLETEDQGLFFSKGPAPQQNPVQFSDPFAQPWSTLPSWPNHVLPSEPTSPRQQALSVPDPLDLVSLGLPPLPTLAPAAAPSGFDSFPELFPSSLATQLNQEVGFSGTADPPNIQVEPGTPTQHESPGLFEPEIKKGVKPQLVAGKPWIRVNESTRGKNKRSANIQAFKPEEVYTQLPARPASWHPFRYTKYGELAEGEMYSATQIRDYLYKHPLHAAPCEDGSQRLRIWIQRAPADSARRYPAASSSRCRFQGCYAPGNRIMHGHYRVCFDEQSWRNQDTDPFINAGYVHLFCLEKYLDLPQLIRDLNFIPDNRSLFKEQGRVNRMSLGRELVHRTAEKFITACRSQTVPQFMARFSKGLAEKGHELQFSGTLAELLTVAKFLEESPTRARQRQGRGASSGLFDHPLGNLIKMYHKGNKTFLGSDDSEDGTAGIVVDTKAVAKPPTNKKRKADAVVEDVEPPQSPPAKKQKSHDANRESRSSPPALVTKLQGRFKGTQSSGVRKSSRLASHRPQQSVSSPVARVPSDASQKSVQTRKRKDRESRSVSVAPSGRSSSADSLFGSEGGTTDDEGSDEPPKPRKRARRSS